MIVRFFRWLACFTGNHDWTCKATENIAPDPDRVKADPVGYFWDYAAMYCKRCGLRWEG